MRPYFKLISYKIIISIYIFILYSWAYGEEQYSKKVLGVLKVSSLKNLVGGGHNFFSLESYLKKKI